MNNISITILTKNSQDYLYECLSSLQQFDEIIILDNGSEDKTLDIAKMFKNVKIFKHEFTGFGTMKQLAVSYTVNDWILSVDSDEIFPELLVKEILELNLQKLHVYSMLRDNYYNKKLIKACGWNNDIQIRLFNKKITNFNDKQVHEGLIIKSDLKIIQLQNSFKHYPFKSATELLQKMNNYSTLYANEHQYKKNATPWSAFLKGTFAFIKNYFLQRGIFYGYEGLLIAISNANGVFYKYIKLYEANKK